MAQGVGERIAWTLGAALVWLHVAGAADALAQSANLVANPRFVGELPVSGWIANHREDWVRQHPAFQATCKKAEVVEEVRFLNRLITHDQFVLSLLSPAEGDNPAALQRPTVTRQDRPTLGREIVIADELIAQLQALPACDASAAATPDGAHASSSVPVPPQSDGAAASSEVAATPRPATADTEEDRLVIRFDERMAALTPSGIRAFNQAVAASRSGKKIQLVIEGCEAGADFSSGSACARRLYSLTNRLQEAGVKSPARLFGGLP